MGRDSNISPVLVWGEILTQVQCWCGERLLRKSSVGVGRNSNISPVLVWGEILM